MIFRLAIFVSHPVQYHVPIWQELAKKRDIMVKVHYFSDHSVRGDIDSDFRVPVAWDQPLLDNYEYTFITRNANLEKPNSVRIPNVKDILKNQAYDGILINGYTYHFERQLVRVAKQLGIKVIIRGEFADYGKQRNFFKSLLRDSYLKWFYSHIDAFCYIGKEAYQHLLRLKIPEDKLFFSPYSVNTDFFDLQYKNHDGISTRAKLGLNRNQFVFLFSGKLIPRKAPLLLLEALELLPNRDSVALIILGDGPLKKQVIEKGHEVLGKRFKFMGFVNQSELGQYFLAANAFVLPSYYEAWGLVVNEAMQFGLPIIVSDHVNCHKDLVIKAKTGFVFSSGDKYDLSKTLHKLSKDHNKSIEIGKNAQQHIQLYSTEASVQGILKAIHSFYSC